jgi:hypothetical protein
MEKNILLILLFRFQLAMSLKSSDFCITKQEVCKGFYNEKYNYQIKCELIKCNDKLSYECESNVCSKNKATCNEYKDMDIYLKILNLQLITTEQKLFQSEFKDKNRIVFFKKHIKECKNKFYKFKSNDFCVNGQNCTEIVKIYKILAFNHRSFLTSKNIHCKCPIKQSFSCGKYCTTDSIACDYYKLMKNEKKFEIIKDCGNHNIKYMNL